MGKEDYDLVHYPNIIGVNPGICEKFNTLTGNFVEFKQRSGRCYFTEKQIVNGVNINSIKNTSSSWTVLTFLSNCNDWKSFATRERETFNRCQSLGYIKKNDN